MGLSGCLVRSMYPKHRLISSESESEVTYLPESEANEASQFVPPTRPLPPLPLTSPVCQPTGVQQTSELPPESANPSVVTTSNQIADLANFLSQIPPKSPEKPPDASSSCPLFQDRVPQFSSTPSYFRNFMDINLQLTKTCGQSSRQETNCLVNGPDGEWSFTLYDLEGRGKITKQDLAALMRSMYELLGASLGVASSTTPSVTAANEEAGRTNAKVSTTANAPDVCPVKATLPQKSGIDSCGTSSKIQGKSVKAPCSSKEKCAVGDVGLRRNRVRLAESGIVNRRSVHFPLDEREEIFPVQSTELEVIAENEENVLRRRKVGDRKKKCSKKTPKPLEKCTENTVDSWPPLEIETEKCQVMTTSMPDKASFPSKPQLAASRDINGLRHRLRKKRLAMQQVDQWLDQHQVTLNQSIEEEVVSANQNTAGIMLTSQDAFSGQRLPSAAAQHTTSSDIHHPSGFSSNLASGHQNATTRATFRHSTCLSPPFASSLAPHQNQALFLGNQPGHAGHHGNTTDWRAAVLAEDSYRHPGLRTSPGHSGHHHPRKEVVIRHEHHHLHEHHHHHHFHHHGNMTAAVV